MGPGGFGESDDVQRLIEGKPLDRRLKILKMLAIGSPQIRRQLGEQVEPISSRLTLTAYF